MSNEIMPGNTENNNVTPEWIADIIRRYTCGVCINRRHSVLFEYDGDDPVVRAILAGHGDATSQGDESEHSARETNDS